MVTVKVTVTVTVIGGISMDFPWNFHGFSAEFPVEFPRYFFRKSSVVDE